MNTVAVGGGRLRKIGGWKPEPLWRRDKRDRFFLPKPRELPAEYDIKELSNIAVFDQMDVGDCVYNAVCSAAAFVVFKQTGKIPVFSRLFGYAMTRLLEGTPLDQDSGLYVPDAFKSLRRDGVCFEDTWPYGHGHDRFMIDPSPEAKAEALLHQGLFFYRCPSQQAIKESLLQGWPLVFGTAVAEDFVDDGEFRLPGHGAGFDSGHSMVLRGWSDTKVLKDGTVGAYRVRNSWGEVFRAPDCEPGDGWVAYDLFHRGYATDAITLRGIEIPEDSRP